MLMKYLWIRLKTLEAQIWEYRSN